MNTTQRRLRRGFALACLVGALAAPAASAGPIDPSPVVNPDKQGTQPADFAVQAPVAQPAGVSDDGFDWGDAAIGASGMLALTAIAGGAALALGRLPRRSVA
jgi:hypothetical protein